MQQERADAEMEGMLKKGRITIFSFTRNGTELSRRLYGMLQETTNPDKCSAFAPSKYSGDGVMPMPENIKEYIGENWGKASYIFVGAAGIAVRCIASSVKDKYTDSPVLVIDEKGQYVIPLLSGHVGGAAVMADEIAKLTGAIPVHTTATDVQGKFAVDVFARNNNLIITDRGMVKKISSAVLEGEKTALYIQDPSWEILGEIPDGIIPCASLEEAGQYRYIIAVSEYGSEYKNDRILVLSPRNITAGIGCRKGIEGELLETGLKDILKTNGLCMEQIKTIASIDLKKDEAAIVRLAGKYHIPFITFAAQELAEIQNVSSSSDFVKKVTGVDNVCERAARMCCREGQMIQEKTVRDSMTCALVKCPVKIQF